MSFYRVHDTSCNQYYYFRIEPKNTTALPNFNFYMAYGNQAWIECPVTLKSKSYGRLSSNYEFNITTPGAEYLDLEFRRESSYEKGTVRSVSFNQLFGTRSHFRRLEEISKDMLPETLQTAEICRMAIPHVDEEKSPECGTSTLGL